MQVSTVSCLGSTTVWIQSGVVSFVRGICEPEADAISSTNCVNATLMRAKLQEPTECQGSLKCAPIGVLLQAGNS